MQGLLTNNKLKRPNGTGSYFVSAQKPEVIQASIKDVHGKKHTKSFRFIPNNKASYARAENEAQNWLSDQLRARNLGQATFAASPSMKVSDFLSGWLDGRIAYIKPNTYRNYDGAIRNWINPYIGNQKLSTLTVNSIEDLYSKLKLAGYKPGTTNVVHRVLSKAFKDAVRKQYLVTNPMLNVERIKGKSTPVQPIPLDDFVKIYIAAQKDPYMHARVEVGMVLSPRQGEVLGLKWSDVDFSSKTLLIERQLQWVKGLGLVFQSVKQDEVRTVRLTDKQVEILTIHRMQQDMLRSQRVEDRKTNPKLPEIEDNDLIFPNTVGRPLDAKKDRKWWLDLLAQAGVPHYAVHRMRKTALTNLSVNGIDIPTIMKFSGHTQASTLLNSYVFATPESVVRAHEVMDRLRPAN
jgi:integrase